MKLLRYTLIELQTIFIGIKEQYNYIEPIDEDYNVIFFIDNYGDHQLKVTLFWNLGCSESDSDEVISDNYFIIHKTESLRKFTKEINDILDVIVSKPFDSELSDDEFNQLNND